MEIVQAADLLPGLSDEERDTVERLAASYATEAAPARLEITKERIRAVADGTLTPAELLGIGPSTTARVVETARSLVHSGDLAAARPMLENLLQLDPRHTQAGVLLAGIDAREGRHAAAAERLERTIAFDPTDAGARLMLAEQRLRLGERDRARDELTALAGAPGGADQVAVRARSLLAALESATRR